MVSDITQDSCVLSWKAPYSDGGTPITGYTIFKREMFRRSNQEVGRIPVVPGSLQRAFEFKVPYLMEGTSYEFQVVAENKNGFSEPLVTAADVHPRKMTGTMINICYKKCRCRILVKTPLGLIILSLLCPQMFSKCSR